MTNNTTVETLRELEAHGFDRSAELQDSPGKYRVRCSECDALVVQGVATHERGCPNRTHECAECWTQIPAGQRICEDCANPESLDDDDFVVEHAAGAQAASHAHG